MYNTIPKCKEWLIVNYVVNVTKGFLQRVFIFKGEMIIDDYIKNCKSRTRWQCKKNTRSNFLSFFPISISQINMHLLILNGHGSHVTFEVMGQAQKFGLDMVILPLHTSHPLQPLNVSCWINLFKTTFGKDKNNNMVRSNYQKPKKKFVG
jgi:hypothetical protein